MQLARVPDAQFTSSKSPGFRVLSNQGCCGRPSCWESGSVSSSPLGSRNAPASHHGPRPFPALRQARSAPRPRAQSLCLRVRGRFRCRHGKQRARSAFRRDLRDSRKKVPSGARVSHRGSGQSPIDRCRAEPMSIAAWLPGFGPLSGLCKAHQRGWCRARSGARGADQWGGEPLREGRRFDAHHGFA